MTMTRRGFLSASAALATMAALRPVRWAGASVPREADVVVIGAGAAGIAAARRIAAAKRKVIVIEAASQVGGRCMTDVSTFGLPFDRGARWLYNPDNNPMINLARNLGLDLSQVSLGQKIRIGRRYARPGETEEFLAALVRAKQAITAAARGRLDETCAAAIPSDLGDWAGTVEFVLGAGATGKDLKDLSAVDKAHARDRTATIGCKQGLGTLIAKLGGQLPLSLSTPATRIAWNNRNVAVDTPSGRITAHAAIITVSTNVLTAGGIKFVPDLPKRYLDAAARLSLGSYDHIALQMPGNPLGLSHDDVLIEQSSSTHTGQLYANIGGSSLCVMDIGGSFGRDLSAQGEAAMVAFATEWLTKLFGSDAAKAIKKTGATRWNDQAYVRGAMSAAAPGGQFARSILTEPIGCLFVAGEATHENLWGTVDGAWESGERAANAALRKIGPLREAMPARVRGRPVRRYHRRVPTRSKRWAFPIR